MTFFFFWIIDATPAQIKALDALKFDLQVKSRLNEPEVQNNFKLGKSKNKTKRVNNFKMSLNFCLNDC